MNKDEFLNKFNLLSKDLRDDIVTIVRDLSNSCIINNLDNGFKRYCVSTDPILIQANSKTSNYPLLRNEDSLWFLQMNGLIRYAPDAPFDFPHLIDVFAKDQKIIFELSKHFDDYILTFPSHNKIEDVSFKEVSYNMPSILINGKSIHDFDEIDEYEKTAINPHLFSRLWQIREEVDISGTIIRKGEYFTNKEYNELIESLPNAKDKSNYLGRIKQFRDIAKDKEIPITFKNIKNLGFMLSLCRKGRLPENPFVLSA